MWRRVDLVWTDVSEERIASIFRVEKIRERGTSLQTPNTSQYFWCVQTSAYEITVWSKQWRPCRGIPSYTGEEVFASQLPGQLYWRELELLVRPPRPDKSKVSGQTTCSPWSSMLGVSGVRLTTPAEKSTITKTAEPTWRRSRHTQGCSASQEEESMASNIPYLSVCICWNSSRQLLVDKREPLLRNKEDEVDSKRFWRWCIILRITEFLDFVHRPVF
jgi:hypothetical protein